VSAARAGRLDRAEQALRQLEVETVSLEPDVPVRLATLRAGARLKPPGGCVLLAAEQAGGAVVTVDDRLAAAARERGLAGAS
jgi:hypothetical protein